MFLGEAISPYSLLYSCNLESFIKSERIKLVTEWSLLIENQIKVQYKLAVRLLIFRNIYNYPESGLTQT